jgi:hypothetical protein
MYLGGEIDHCFDTVGKGFVDMLNDNDIIPFSSERHAASPYHRVR